MFSNLFSKARFSMRKSNNPERLAEPSSGESAVGQGIAEIGKQKNLWV